MTNDDLKQLERIADDAQAVVRFFGAVREVRAVRSDLEQAQARLKEVQDVLAETLAKNEEAQAVLRDVRSQADERRRNAEREAIDAANAAKERIEASHWETAAALERMKDEVTAKGEELKKLNEQIQAARRAAATILGRVG